MLHSKVSYSQLRVYIYIYVSACKSCVLLCVGTLARLWVRRTTNYPNPIYQNKIADVKNIYLTKICYCIMGQIIRGYKSSLPQFQFFFFFAFDQFSGKKSKTTLRMNYWKSKGKWRIIFVLCDTFNLLGSEDSFFH